jgi:hypothetical protein
MKMTRCPTCHSHITIEAIAQDEAARDLLNMFSKMDSKVSRPLAMYIGLFRPAKRDLTNERACRLIHEVLALCKDHDRLAAALAATIESLRSKENGALKNHNYLIKVIENTQITNRELSPVIRENKITTPGRITKAEQGLISIESVKDRYK